MHTDFSLQTINRTARTHVYTGTNLEHTMKHNSTDNALESPTHEDNTLSLLIFYQEYSGAAEM